MHITFVKFIFLFFLWNIYKTSYAINPARELICMQIEKEDSVYHIVEEMPMFPGGDKEMFSFVSRNLQLPSDEDSFLITRVVTSFVVEKDGTITDIKIVYPEKWENLPEEEMPLLGKTFIKLVESFPLWIPGKDKGEPVRVKYFLPVSFHPKKYK